MTGDCMIELTNEMGCGAGFALLVWESKILPIKQEMWDVDDKNVYSL